MQPVSPHAQTSRLDAELSAAPVATLAVVLDLRISLQPEPLRQRLVLLGSDTQGALGLETLEARHCIAI